MNEWEFEPYHSDNRIKMEDYMTAPVLSKSERLFAYEGNAYLIKDNPHWGGDPAKRCFYAAMVDGLVRWAYCYEGSKFDDIQPFMPVDNWKFLEAGMGGVHERPAR